MTQEELIVTWCDLRSVKREADRQIQLEECKTRIERLCEELRIIGAKIQERRDARENVPRDSPDAQLLERTLVSFGTEMQLRQRMLQGARIREGELVEMESWTVVTDDERAAWVLDLVAIQCIPTVQKIVIDGVKIVVTVGPIITVIQQKRFDLGDYDIDVPIVVGTERSVLVRCVRGSLDGARQHPYNTDITGDFCFGARASEIAMLQRRGCYRQLIELVMECVHHVNPEHEDRVLGRYKEVQGDGVTHASREDTGSSLTEDTRILPDVPGGD